MLLPPCGGGPGRGVATAGLLSIMPRRLVLNLPAQAKEQTRPIPIGRVFPFAATTDFRARLHAATDHPETNPCHCRRADCPDGDHVGSVDGDDAEGGASAR